MAPSTPPPPARRLLAAFTMASTSCRVISPFASSRIAFPNEIFISQSLSRRPAECASAQEVNVQVKDGLSGAGANVEDGAVSLLDLALSGDHGGGQMAAADDFGVTAFRFFQSCKMAFGDDEHMGRRLRINVFKREDVFIFENSFRRNLAANDAAEEAIGIGHSCVTCRNDNKSMARLASCTKGPRLMVFGCQIAKGLRIDIPGAFKGIVQVSQHEVCEEEKHGSNRDGDETKRQVAKRKKEKQKENGRGCDRDEEEKRARNAFGAEGKALVTVSAGLMRDLEQMLVGPAFGIVLGMDVDDAGNDRRKKLVGALCILALG